MRQKRRLAMQHLNEENTDRPSTTAQAACKPTVTASTTSSDDAIRSTDGPHTASSALSISPFRT